MTGFIVCGVVAFLAMEGVSYAMHRFVYHGFLWILHRSHHSKRRGAFELNDLFPLFFSIVGASLFLVGLESSHALLVAIAAGVSAYGILYFAVHDLYIHGRCGVGDREIRWLRPIRDAHDVHHRYGGEPYGLLFYWTQRFARRTVSHD